MTRRVLSVGQCVPDTASIKQFLTSTFDVTMVSAADGPEAIDQLRKSPFDLVLINRKLDIDYSDGIDIIRQLKADAELSQIPVMLITNYPEHQDNAVAAGAERGFGKNELGQSDVISRLSVFLG